MVPQLDEERAGQGFLPRDNMGSHYNRSLNPGKAIAAKTPRSSGHIALHKRGIVRVSRSSEYG